MQQEKAPPRLAMPPLLHAEDPGQSDLLDDAALSTWLDERRRAGEVVGYLHGDHLCKVVRLRGGDGQLLPVSPEKQAKRALKELFRKGLLEHLELPQADLHDAHFLDITWTFKPVRSTHEISSLVDDRLTMMGLAGRGQDISTRTAQKVWAEAGGRCMFEGCGDDLTEIPLHREAARVGYLAHIVASDPRGPRGSRAHSHALSDEPSNIMLMCDKHHRLIDVIAQDDYWVANPTVEGENFAEKWNTDGGARAKTFITWCDHLAGDLRTILAMQTPQEIREQVSKVFGTPASSGPNTGLLAGVGLGGTPAIRRPPPPLPSTPGLA